ncbi:hypothetical protein HHI36_012844 [Cryptolaemus montrouzieri]|uniref:Endonuclease-reverse transcriptase n=1 Tax=Cryptolaemus montrouzieri TaxID=559131 RepID=A0ABD2NFE4_9CUCU
MMTRMRKKQINIEQMEVIKQKMKDTQRALKIEIKNKEMLERIIVPWGQGYQIATRHLKFTKPHTILAPEIEAFTLEKLYSSARSMRNEKAQGPDGMAPESVKLSIETLPMETLQMFNELLKKQIFPSSWKVANLSIGITINPTHLKHVRQGRWTKVRNNTLLAAELKKLTQDDLIDILIHKKLTNGSNKDQVNEFVNNQHDINEFFIEKRKNLKSATCEQCCRLSTEVRSIKNDLELVSKLSFHLEKRTEEQAGMITFLKKEVYHGSFPSTPVPSSSCSGNNKRNLSVTSSPQSASKNSNR